MSLAARNLLTLHVIMNAYRLTRLAGLAGVLTVVSACAIASDDDADFTEVAEISAGSNPYSNTRVVGTIDLGFARTVLYAHTPRYRALKFHAEAGTQLELFARSTHGDPMLWLADAGFHVLAFNDDANEESNANISIESLAATGDYYLVFRDKHLESHYVEVAALQLNLPPNAPTVAAVETEYEALVTASALPTMEVPGSWLPYLAKGLYERWRTELSAAPGVQVNAYALTVAGQTVWLVRKYQPGSGLEAAAYVETGPMLGIAGGATELIDSWEH